MYKRQLQGTLTEDNYRTKLENMYQKSDNALFRLELSSVKEQLIGLQAYKDGVDEYTEGCQKPPRELESYKRERTN